MFTEHPKLRGVKPPPPFIKTSGISGGWLGRLELSEVSFTHMSGAWAKKTQMAKGWDTWGFSFIPHIWSFQVISPVGRLQGSHTSYMGFRVSKVQREGEGHRDEQLLVLLKTFCFLNI